jgi:hypothetical protein
MAEQWPGALEDKLNEADFSYQMGDTTIQSETEIGEPKVRRRFTRAVDRISCSIIIEKSDVDTFFNFYRTTLNGGVNAFEFTDPISNTTKEYRFDTSSPPQITPIGGNTLNLRMSWIVLP